MHHLAGLARHEHPRPQPTTPAVAAPDMTVGPRTPWTGDLWQAAADTLPDSAAVLSPDGVILAVNEAWRRMALEGGRTADDVGANYLSVCDEAAATLPEAASAASCIRRVLSGGAETTSTEYQLGTRSYRLLVRACTSAGAGAVVRHEDVTVVRHAEREAAEARSYIDAVTDSMGEGLFVLDPEGRVRLMNAAAEHLLGWSFEAIEGQVMHDLTHFMHPDGRDYERSACPILTAYEDGTVVRVRDDTFIRRDGSRLPVAYTASPLQSSQGEMGCVVVFMDATSIRSEERRLKAEVDKLSWIRRVQDAVAEDRLMLYSQPIIDLGDMHQVQQELLLRVRERDGSVCLPAPYLETAEAHGLMGTIDRWVIRRAVEHAAAGSPIEVNVSASSLSDASLLGQLAEWLHASGTDPQLLTFEITETAIISDEAAARAFVSGLHDLGCLIALDDFGAGYGGFTYLKQLSVDFLKIDQEFVRDLATNDRSRHVVQAIVNLARGFGLQTVAEGVEDQAALEMLRELGIDMAQGFYLGRPAPLLDMVPAARNDQEQER